MERQVNYAVVGLFVILLGAAWLAISLWLALGDFGTNYTRYHVFMNESVSGLHLDAPVKYRGVEIGRVRDIGLNPLVPEQVQLTLDIEADVSYQGGYCCGSHRAGCDGYCFCGPDRRQPGVATVAGE